MTSPSLTNSETEDLVFEYVPLINMDSSDSSGIDVYTDEDLV